MTIYNAKNTDDIAKVIREEWSEIDFLRCDVDQLADEGIVSFRGQNEKGHHYHFIANVMTDSITSVDPNGFVKHRIEF